MNREIKFRAWDETRKRMILPTTIQFKKGELSVGVGSYFPSKFQLMQSTGLKDKNGKEIYEGDIVGKYKEDTDTGEIMVVEVVKWSDETGGWRIWDKIRDDVDVYEEDWSEEGGLYFGEDDAKEKEIIGNIYENPEGENNAS